MDKPVKGIFNGVVISVLIYVVIFTLVSCACGVQAQLPVPVAEGTQAAPEVSMGATPARVETVKLTKGEVCGVDNENGGLNVRAAAGVDAPVIAVRQDGDTVTLLGDWKAVDGGIWLRIGGGWVNGRYVCLSRAR